MSSTNTSGASGRSYPSLTISLMKEWLQQEHPQETLKGSRNDLLDKVKRLTNGDPLSILAGHSATSASRSASRRGSKGIQVSPGKSNLIWVLEPASDSRIVEEDCVPRAFGSFQDNVKKVHQKVEAVLTKLRPIFPMIPDLVLLVGATLDPLVGLIRSTSQIYLARLSLTGSKFADMIGNLLISNCIVASQETKWPMVTLGATAEYPVDEFKQAIHSLHCLPIPESGTATWIDPLQAQLGQQTVERKVNEGLGILSDPKCLTLDDDVLSTKGKDVTHTRLAHIVHNPRKGDGLSFNVLSDTFFSTIWAVFATLRGGGNQLMRAYSEVKITAQKYLVFDRGFTRLTATTFHQSKGIKTIGILDERWAGDRPFSIVTADNAEFVNPVTGLSIECFPGSGPYCKVASLESGERCVAAVQTLKAKPHIVFFLLSNWDNATLANLNNFARVRKPISHTDHAGILDVAADSGDAEAKRLYEHVKRTGTVFSQIQLDHAWFMGRFFRMSSSQSNRWIRRVIKDAPFPRVRNLLRIPSPGTSVQQEQTSEATATVEARPSVEVREAVAFASAEEMDDENAVSDIEDLGSDSEDDEYVDDDDYFDASIGVEQPTSQQGTASSGEGTDIASAATSTQPASSASTQTLVVLAQESQSQSESAPSSTLPVPVDSVNFFNDFVAATANRKYLKTDAILRGRLVEPNAFASVCKVFDGGKLFTTGVIHHKTIRYAVASPDGIGFIGGQITGVEIKCSSDYILLGEDALIPIKVSAGDVDYQRLVPKEYMCQLLHEAFVLDVRFMLVVLANPAGLAQLILVEYEDDDLQEYEKYLMSDMLQQTFDWFDDSVYTRMTNSELIERIPSWASPASRRILISHIPLWRAVYLYRRDTTRPIGPTHIFREFVTAMYNFGKAATDIECKHVVQATKGLVSLNLPFRQKYTVRMLYFPIIAAVRAFSIYEAVCQKGSMLDGMSVKSFRAVLNEVSMNDRLIRLGRLMRGSGIPLGEVSMATRPTPPLLAPPPPRSPDSQLENLRLTAAHPLEMQKFLISHVAKQLRRPVQENRDLLSGTRLVMDPDYRSMTSDSVILSEKHLLRCRALESSFNSRPAVTNNRNERLAYWDAGGYAFRWSPGPWHARVEMIEEDSRQFRPMCFWCQSRPVKMSLCLLCGESFCSMTTCWESFHSKQPCDESTNATDTNAEILESTSASTPGSGSQGAEDASRSASSSSNFSHRLLADESPLRIAGRSFKAPSTGPAKKSRSSVGRTSGASS